MEDLGYNVWGSLYHRHDGFILDLHRISVQRRFLEVGFVRLIWVCNSSTSLMLIYSWTTSYTAQQAYNTSVITDGLLKFEPHADFTHAYVLGIDPV